MYYLQSLQNGTFITIALDSIQTADKGPFAEKHSCEDAFLFNNK